MQLRDITMLVAVVGVLSIYGFAVVRGMQLGSLGKAFVQLVSQSYIFIFLVLADGGMFWYMLTSLKDGEMAAELAALVGALIGAVTQSIALAAKDFFNERDDNGV